MALVAMVGTLAGGALVEDALGVELQAPPAVELGTSPVPPIEGVEPLEAVEAPTEPQPPIAESPPSRDVEAPVERAADGIVTAVAPPPLPSGGDVPTISGVVVEAASDLTGHEQSSPVESRPKPPAKRLREPDRRSAGPSRGLAEPAGTVATSTVMGPGAQDSPAAVPRVEHTEVSSLLPREAGAAAERPPRPVPSRAIGTALLQGASAGGLGFLSAPALSAPVGAGPETRARLVPLTVLLRSTLSTSPLERPG